MAFPYDLKVVLTNRLYLYSSPILTIKWNIVMDYYAKITIMPPKILSTLPTNVLKLCHALYGFILRGPHSHLTATLTREQYYYSVANVFQLVFG